eukprot:CAMPEP_0196660734 /NCGR_PEP_ID=MMETSP1086-20130531/41097_1 /TAXON_ID=77921 /ORGANISM="Cyanoptyche  gloeocystis , Strain SAG4.97" /LENGTH=443 /DNA_ID=CAMNT_0041995305 /DNA_START=50 /DNA_END=1381 /DNA_ORIENTATION=-
MRGAWLFALLLPLLIVCVFGGKQSQQILVLLDDEVIRSTHSNFFSALAERGHNLTFKLADDENLKIAQYGIFLYDSIVLFAPGVEELGGDVDLASILAYIDSGHNMLVAASPATSSFTKELAAECGVKIDKVNSYVIDHFEFDASDISGNHTLITATNVIMNPVIVGSEPFESPILFRGVGMKKMDSNALVTKILTAPTTSYSFVPDKAADDKLLATGADIVLMAAMQARNNARVTIAASLDMFSNALLASPVTKLNADASTTTFSKSGNAQFVTAVTKWTLHERGLLRAQNVRYGIVGGEEFPRAFRVKDELYYKVQIDEFKDGKWAPFAADDVQLEFIMIDPYQRVTLRHDGKGTFFTTFPVPDVYGVFKLDLKYRRLGYTTIFLSNQVAVRPFDHNEYERFIVSAYPYYASIFSMMSGFVVFCIVYLYSKDSSSKASTSS